ncbi:DHHC palmitoyltransferase-domain-containing protein [Roridomyces roridus]|uniref:Palmitoyltransferase n=1 Tax=Roridomyces roridus TaxID=1738132 RepID=A0AAD7B1U9_9AGAR|nr:DHHC palmitoyltransferase-domain-containing protein [Roridomyces roridus]
MQNGAPPADKQALSPPTCFGTISEARFAAHERREARLRKPQPWAVRKLMVVTVLGIMGYTAYVYAGRFAVRLIRHGRRPAGIGLLVGWSPLYLWMVWAYLKVIFTPPGYAADHIPQTPQPLFPPTQWNQEVHPYNGDVDAYDDAVLAEIEAGRIGGPPYENLPPTNGDAHPHPPAPAPKIKRTPSSRPIPPGRFPPPTAALLPPNRYCTRCEIVKPYRAHHCRMCGKCVLKFDHHCPWIGQCVGARNHKFFLNFALATFALTSYTFASLLAFNVHRDGDVDPQEVVIIALAAFFALFTSTLAVAHTRLILLSQTTVESYTVQTLKEREADGLRIAGLKEWDCRAKRQALASYDAEWGAPNTEGNLWWAGSKRKGWEDVMGASVWGWIFPIGAPLGDGLHYVPNPRFDADGRWRRRSEWPAELR